MAGRLGLSAQAFSKWENGTNTPDIALLPSIADLFDVSLDFSIAFAHQEIGEFVQAEERWHEILRWLTGHGWSEPHELAFARSKLAELSLLIEPES